MPHPANQVIEALQLSPLPDEGGFFRRQWISAACDATGRPAAGLIWFLVTREGFSAWHRVDAAERWEFHAGDPVEHVQLEAGTSPPRVTLLGHDRPGEPSPRPLQRRLVVPADAWQGARLAPPPTGEAATRAAHGWALVSCTMTPAWEEKGFALGERAALLHAFPAAAGWIRALTR